ncbi:uncharacterized protein LOC114462525 [Tachysurus ichikawai]
MSLAQHKGSPRMHQGLFHPHATGVGHQQSVPHAGIQKQPILQRSASLPLIGADIELGSPKTDAKVLNTGPESVLGPSLLGVLLFYVHCSTRFVSYQKIIRCFGSCGEIWKERGVLTFMSAPDQFTTWADLVQSTYLSVHGASTPSMSATQRFDTEILLLKQAQKDCFPDKVNALQNEKHVFTLTLLDSQLPRAHCPVGKITQVFPSSDGTVRVAEVTIGDCIYSRPVSKLIVLPELPND